MSSEWVEGPVFAAMLEETIRLMRQTRDHIAWLEARADLIDDERRRLQQAAACSRVTARLTAVLSWLLTHQAIHAGEVVEAGGQHPGLFGVGDPRVAEDGDSEGLSRRLQTLLAASGALFQRAARLETVRCPN